MYRCIKLNSSVTVICLALTSLWGGEDGQVPFSFSQSLLANSSLNRNRQLSQPIGTRFMFRYRFQPIRRLVGRTPDQEHSPAQYLILPSSIGNGSGKRKAESPKAAAPTTAGPGYHLAPGNTAESRRRQKPIPTRSNHEQRGRDTTTAAAC